MTAAGFIYAIGAPNSDRVKIGFATDPRRRLAELRCASSEDLRIVGTAPGSRADERALHARFVGLRIRGEWFRQLGDVAEFVSGLTPPRLSLRKRAAFSARPAARSATWQRCIDALLRMEATVRAATGLSRSRMSFYAVGDHAFFTRVAGGLGFNVRTLDRVVQWFADNWPDNAEWPSDVPRPERTAMASPEPAQ